MKDKIFNLYITFLDFLSEIIGDNYEFVLRDITEDNFPIIYSKNTFITSRTMNSPLTNISNELLSSNSQQYVVNLKGIGPTGKIIRSSTFVIKDFNDNNIGLLGIHFDDQKVLKAIDKMLQTIYSRDFHLDAEPTDKLVNPENNTIEYFSDDLDNLIKDIYDNVLKQQSIDDASDLLPNEKIYFVKLLNEQGLFNIKGAVPYLATKLNVSNASVYRYLSESKNL